MTELARPTIFAVAAVFLRLGIQGFGGLGAVLALINHHLIECHGWLNETDVTEALTYTKLLPGSTVVQVVAYLGWKLGGLAGAMTSTIAFLLPAFLVMLGLAVGYCFIAPFSQVSATLGGLTASVVGLLVMTTWKLGRKNLAKSWELVVAIAVFVASARYNFNPAFLVIAAGFLGVLLESRRAA